MMNKQLIAVAAMVALVGVAHTNAMQGDNKKNELHHAAAGYKHLPKGTVDSRLVNANVTACYYLNYHNDEHNFNHDLMKVDGDGNLPLHEAAAFGRLDNVKILLKAMIDNGHGNAITARNHKGETALDKARYFKHKNIVAYLKKMGGKPGKKLN